MQHNINKLREEFEEFVKESKTLHMDYRDADFRDMEDFWLKEITLLLESIEEEVKGEKKEQLDKNDLDNYGACYAIAGHNHALDKVLQIISSYKK
jgi:hypothetical protein